VCKYRWRVDSDVDEASPWFIVLGESAGVGFGVAVFAGVLAADVRVYAVICQTTPIQNALAFHFPDKQTETPLRNPALLMD